MPGLPGAVKKQGDDAIILQKNIAEGKQVIIDQDGENSAGEIGKPITPDKPAGGGEQPKNYEQMYSVLKGKYDKEVPELTRQLLQVRQELNTANQTIANLNDIVVRLNTAGSSAGAAVGAGEIEQPAGQGSAAGAAGKSGKLKREDYEGYGEEMLLMVDRLNSLADENEALKGRLGEVDTRVGEVNSRMAVVGEEVQKTASEKFFDTLTKQVKDWRKINKDDGWLRWLAQEDPGTGIVRQDLLDKAHSTGNVSRVAYWFNAFKQETGWKSAKGGGPSLDTEIEPETGSGGPAGDVGGDFTPVTKAQYAKASKDLIAKKITLEQFNKISADFQRSIQEGKV